MAWWDSMDKEDQEKMDWIAERLARRGEVSMFSAQRLLRDFLYREDMSDHYLQTEVGLVALALSVIYPFWDEKRKPTGPSRHPVGYAYSVKEIGQPVPRQMTENLAFQKLTSVKDARRHQWFVSVVKEEAPKVLVCWDRVAREEFAKLQRATLEQRMRSGKLTPGDEGEERRLLREGDEDLRKAREEWLMERRKYWPFAVVVDNTKKKK